jgi:hypothetical protein
MNDKKTVLLIDVDYSAIFLTVVMVGLAYSIYPIAGYLSFVVVLFIPLLWCYLAYNCPLTKLHMGFGRFIDKYILRK